MTHRLACSGRGVAVAVALAASLVAGSAARAHEDPRGCSDTGPALILSTFRADAMTALAGPVSECETINYRARLMKTGDVDSACAFSGGVFTLTTPDGVVHTISANVPCVGGNTGQEGCFDVINSIDSGFIPYTVSPSDIAAGLVTATTQYSGGVSHDAEEANSPGVSSETPKSTPVVRCDAPPCTIGICDPTKFGSAACSSPPVVCDDGDVCTDDACDPTTGRCVFTPNGTCGNDAICRTPGFWGTHGTVTQQVIARGGGCLEVCGEVITSGLASSVGSADSALEAICVSPRGDQRLQLARQLTAMALNCAVSGFGGDCGGNAALGTLFGDCTTACLGGPGVGDCVAAVDCFNNGGVFDPDRGLCGSDPSGSCHARALPETVDSGPASTPGACNRARRNDCTIVRSGEAECTSGNRSATPESCP